MGWLPGVGRKFSTRHLSRVGVSPSWLRHRILIPAFAGSTPSTPAKISEDKQPQAASQTQARTRVCVLLGHPPAPFTAKWRRKIALWVSPKVFYEVPVSGPDSEMITSF